MPGLSVSKFLAGLDEHELRSMLDPGVLDLLDGVFDGRIAGDDLVEAAAAVFPIDEALATASGRERIVGALPYQSRAEFIERVPYDVDTADWSIAQTERAMEFFGLDPSRRATAPLEPLATVDAEYGLFPHQRSLVDRILPFLRATPRRAVLHLPTGVGKTRTAMHIVARTLIDEGPSVVVWLASGRELLDQAREAFCEAWTMLGDRTVDVGAMWGSSSPDPSEFTDGLLVIGLAKGWSKYASDPRWAEHLASKVQLVVFDEAHQAVANTYSELVRDLTLGPSCSLLGLTATPGRTWADIDEDGRLAAMFEHQKVGLEIEGVKDPVEYLMENGYLARPTFRALLPTAGLPEHVDDITTESSAALPQSLAERLGPSQRYVLAVFDAINDLIASEHKRLIVFAATLDHARVLTAALASRGVAAELVAGDTPPPVRARAIRMFKSTEDRPRVLVNFGVLTTGFDAPRATGVVIARPTTSLVLYSQMVGRGTRGPKAGGTETCEIVTIVDPALPGFGDVAAAFNNWEDVW